MLCMWVFPLWDADETVMKLIFAHLDWNDRSCLSRFAIEPEQEQTITRGCVAGDRDWGGDSATAHRVLWLLQA